MTKAMPFLQKAILLSYDPRPLPGAAFFYTVPLTVSTAVPGVTLYAPVALFWV